MPKYYRNIGEAFRTYEAEVLPREVSKYQLHETRRAFYGGAACMLELMKAGTMTDEQAERYNVFVREVHDFCQAVDEGRA